MRGPRAWGFLALLLGACGAPRAPTGSRARELAPLIDEAPLAVLPSQGGPCPQADLSYCVEDVPEGMALAVVRAAVARAATVWAAASDFRLHEVPCADRVDLRIRFHRGDHGDGPFTEEILAHASFPPAYIHFNTVHAWADHPTTEVATDLESVAVHELGHTLGIGHVEDPEAVMYPRHHGVFRALRPQDVTAIRAVEARCLPREVRAREPACLPASLALADCASRPYAVGDVVPEAETLPSEPFLDCRHRRLLLDPVRRRLNDCDCLYCVPTPGSE